MTFNKIRVLFGFILTLLFAISCETEAPRTKLNPDEQKILDSLYNDGITAARKEADFICSALRDSLFQEYVDSILELRLIEVDQIIND